jgi:outer membrane protein assembly factor BamB
VALVPIVLVMGSAVTRAATSPGEIVWSQLQGNAAHGGSLSVGIAPPLERLWTFDVGEGRLGSAGAVIVGDVAIAVGDRAVYGVDLATGRQRWAILRAGGPLTLPAVAHANGKTILAFTDSGAGHEPTLVTEELKPDRPRAGPERIPLDDISTSGITLEDGVAYLGDRDGRVYAIDLSTKKVIWTTPAGEGRIEAPPAIGEGLVIAVARNGDTGEVRILAFDAATGREKWRFTPSFAVGVGSGVTVANGRVFFGMGDIEVHALDLETGKEQWSTRVRSQFSPFVVPAYMDGQLYIVGTSGSESALYRLDAATGERPWDFEFPAEDLRSSPVVVGDYVYVGLGDGTLAQVDRRSGVEVGEDHTGPGSLGAIAVGRDILVVGKNGPGGGLVAFGPDPEGQLLHVLSPTHLRLRHVLTNFAIAFAAVGLLLFLGFRALVRPQTAGPEPEDRGWLPSETEGEGVEPAQEGAEPPEEDKGNS